MHVCSHNGHLLLLLPALQTEEKLPYSFFIEEQELAAELGAHLLKHKVGGQGGHNVCAAAALWSAPFCRSPRQVVASLNSSPPTLPRAGVRRVGAARGVPAAGGVQSARCDALHGEHAGPRGWVARTASRLSARRFQPGPVQGAIKMPACCQACPTQSSQLSGCLQAAQMIAFAPRGARHLADSSQHGTAAICRGAPEAESLFPACRGGAVSQLQPGWTPPGQRQRRHNSALLGPGHSGEAGVRSWMVASHSHGPCWLSLHEVPTADRGSHLGHIAIKWLNICAALTEAVCQTFGSLRWKRICLAAWLPADAQAHMQESHKLGAGGGVEPRCGHRGIRQALLTCCRHQFRLREQEGPLLHVTHSRLHDRMCGTWW